MGAEGIEVSVVIPAFNAADSIGAQLEALAQQGWAGEWEVVVADNGSTDDTVAAVLRSSGHLARLHVVDASGRRGPSHARNEGARHARGDYLLFLDADDVVDDVWLAKMAEASRSADFIAGDVMPSLGGVPIALAQAGLGRRTAWSRILPSPGFLDAAASSNMGVRKSVWESVGGFREDMVAGEDTAFSWDVQLAGHQLVRVPGATVRYHQRPDLCSLARQQYRWGVGVAQLYALFRDRGAPRPSVRGALVRWLALIVSAPLAMTGESRRRDWVGRSARRAGRLAGSLRFRVLCL